MTHLRYDLSNKEQMRMKPLAMNRSLFALLAGIGVFALPVQVCAAKAPRYDVVIRGGEVIDGSGKEGVIADVAIAGDRIVAIEPRLASRGRIEVDARGKVVAPGFINMLSHAKLSLIVDGRALSDLVQGVTLEVLGEGSMGPLSPRMKELLVQRQGDIKYPVAWTTLGEYLDMLVRRGIAPNIASFVGAGTVRENVLGEGDVQPTPDQLAQMQGLVHDAMEEGALGVTDALIYSPNTYAKTPEIEALARVSAQCGGMYITHIRSEGDRLEQAVQETIDIAKASGAPAEIYHFKQAGQRNWDKFAKVVAMIDAARASGVRISADMYLYTAGATGLDAAMPPWAQAGGQEEWIARLKDPVTRLRIAAEMRDQHPASWENLYGAAGPDKMQFLSFKNPALKSLTGKTLAQVAAMRGQSPEETAMDLVIEDGSRVEVAYFLMSEDNIRRAIKLPWMSFGSDEAAPAPEGVFLQSKNHPRAYGNFARLLGHHVRENQDVTLPDAIRRLTSLPADNLSIRDRGRLKPGYYADVVVFDPETISDHATYENPAQLATGMEQVLINGRFALRNGRVIGGATGRVVRGRAWTGATGGGCKTSSSDWEWTN